MMNRAAAAVFEQRAGVTSLRGRRRGGRSGSCTAPVESRTPDRHGTGTLLRPRAAIEPRVRYSRPIRTCLIPRSFGRNYNVNSNPTNRMSLSDKMNWFACIIVTVLLNKSSTQDIIETVDAVVGHSAELPCNVTAEVEDDKLNILAWYHNGSSNAFYSSRDLRGYEAEGSETAPSGRYRLVTGEDGLDKLQIVTVGPSDAGLYQCFADFAASPAHKTFVQLTVIEPPRHLWVLHENGTQVAKASAGANISQNIGPYYVGDTVHLVCVAFGGNPQASLSWWSEQRLLKDTSTPLSAHRVRSDVTYGPLRGEDHGRVISCFAKNNERTSPLSIDVVVDMFLPPELVSLRATGAESGRIRAGETLGLQCRVLGARPPPRVMWRLDENQLHSVEQNVTLEPSQRLVVSEIKLTMDREYDESSLSCCAPAYTRNDDTFVCADKLSLSILYPPSLHIVVEDELDDNNTLVVTKGATIRMACSFQANPAIYQLIWFHEDEILTHGNKDGSEEVQSFLELVDISEAEAGEYVCAATNDEGTAYSEPVIINVKYPTHCEDESIIEYGLGENESINITCNVHGNPAPTLYRWVLVNDEANITTMHNYPQTRVETEDNVLVYERINTTIYSTIFCSGINGVPAEGQSNSPCTFLVTDQTAPRPPAACHALKNTATDIIVKCEKGHSGGLPQKFKFIVKSDSDEHVLSIINGVPEFMIPEPQENYKFHIVAFNDKGESKSVEIDKADVIDESIVPEMPASAVANITTLALALCGGVLLVALAACGLVLCSHERGSRLDLPRAHSDPPLCAYNTEESNCETYHDSEDGSDCNVRRTDSFRRAVSRYPSKNFDVRRTSSFHSTRYINDVDPEIKINEIMRHSNNCRVHSLQNISRKKDMDALCDHLVLHLPPETNYNAPRPMNTFYTMPRKVRQKSAREISDETSEITQTSDGFSLPPPPDEFGTYRAATRIKDIPTKSTPTYTTITKKSNSKEPSRQQYTPMSPMNVIGVPTVSGAHNSLYSYPDEDLHQVNTNPFDDDST